jgi:hypothetical protein
MIIIIIIIIITTTTVNNSWHYSQSFYLKRNVSETAFSLRLQVVPTQLGSLDCDNLFLRRHMKTETETCLRYFVF